MESICLYCSDPSNEELCKSCVRRRKKMTPEEVEEMDKRIAIHRAIEEAPYLCNMCDKETPKNHLYCSEECRKAFQALPYVCIECNTELKQDGPSVSYCETCLANR